MLFNSSSFLGSRSRSRISPFRVFIDFKLGSTVVDCIYIFVSAALDTEFLLVLVLFVSDFIRVLLFTLAVRILNCNLIRLFILRCVFSVVEELVRVCETIDGDLENRFREKWMKEEVHLWL